MTPFERRLTVLIEECAELQKEACKILRFGPLSKGLDGLTSITALTLEIGDVLAAITRLEAEGEVDSDTIQRVRHFKAKALKHMEV